MALTIRSAQTIKNGVTLKGNVDTGYLPSTLFELDASSYTSGSTWADISGNGRDATMQGTLSWSSTGGGSFLYDNNYNNYFDISGSEQGWGMANSPANSTFSIWANLNNISNYQQVGGWRGGIDYWYLILPNGQTEARFDNGTTVDISIDYTPYFGSWALSTFVVNATAGYSKLYINSIEVGSGTISGNFNNGSNPFTIGSHPGNAFSCSGYIGGVTAYNTALTDAEVMAEFNRTKTRYGL